MNETKVLVIEDHAALRDTLLDMLGDLELSADWSDNAERGKQLLESGDYRLVICDNNFPNGNGKESSEGQGLQMLKWMRTSEKHRDTPFILHTADTRLVSTEFKLQELGGIYCEKGQLEPSLKEMVEETLFAHA